MFRYSGRYSLFAGILGVLGLFLVWPIFLTVRGGFIGADGELTLRYLSGVFADPVLREGMWNSLLIAVFTTLACLAITLPLALVGAKIEFWGKTWVTSLILVPLILPPFVGAIGLRAILGRAGGLNALLAKMGLLSADHPGIDFLGGIVEGEMGRFLGVVVMQALHLYPIMYLNISAAMANLDPTLNEAALGLGAGRWRRFYRVTLPLILPGLFAGSTIVFIWAFTELGTPLMFDFYTVTPVQIYWGLQEMASSPRPYALVVVMLTMAVLLYGASRFALGRKGYEMQSKASIASQMKRVTGMRALGAWMLFAGVTFIAVLPHIGVVFSSFTVDGSWYRSVLPQALTLDHYDSALNHKMAMTSIANSLLYASWAVVLCVIIGIAISYLTVRLKVKGGWLLDALAMLPLAVPGLVMAFGYVSMTLIWPFVGAMPGWLDSVTGAMLPGAWHASLNDAPLAGWSVLGSNPNPMVLLIIAYGIRRLPYVVRSVSAGLQQTSGQLEEAALNLGASTARSLRKVVLPLVMANIIAGAILAFSFSMLEVSDSLILAQKEDHYPITKAVFEFYNRLGDGPYIASAMGVWGMALLTVTLVGASVLMGKKLGAIFRV